MEDTVVPAAPTLDDSGATPGWEVVLDASRHDLGQILDVELSGSLNLRRTVMRILEVTRSRFADWAVLVTADPRSESLTLYGGGDLGYAATLRRDVSAELLLRVIESGQHELLSVDQEAAPFDALTALLPVEELRAQAAALRPADVLALPMAARGGTLGALVMVRRSGRGFAPTDVALLGRFADRAALALDSARIYEDHARVARVLEESLRPPGLPVVPGVEIATSFRAAAEHLEIGGDFYDVHGDDGSWLVVLGDVCGKGVDAAVLNSRARQSIRTAARYDRSPGRILSTLNDVLYDDASDKFVTVVCALVSPRDDGSVLVQVAVAGHPAPLVVRADGEVEQPAVTGRLAGVIRHDDPYEEVGFELLSGDAMVLFSDGIYEAKGPRGLYGMDRLRKVLARYAGSGAVPMCEAIEQDVVEHLGGHGHDDMTALVVSPRRQSR
ncbi:MAG TPA: GAF domain-containing SpoIIE family protein phosphatase [Nocardioides sp.]|nr:GAF domain-containing SpoIIE family protein phosphatase [Nocardioides sp.]